jgi:CrcB protein
LGVGLAIGFGGALGALLRYWMSTGVYALLGRDFPYGTLAVNVLGSFLLGLCSVLLIDRLAIGPAWRAGVLIGGLGAFTTFSTFSLETLLLIEQGALLRALLNAVASVVLCLAFVWLGVLIGRQI